MLHTMIQNKNRFLLCLLALALLGLFVFNGVQGERIQHNDGLGWDGVKYSYLARVDPIWKLSSRTESAYYIGRMLPSTIIHVVARALGYDLTPNPHVINAFYIYNCLCLLAALLLLLHLARIKGWSGPSTLIAVSAIFFNYAVLKNASYNPTLTDMSALSLGVLLLYAWTCSYFWLFILATVLASFTWPSLIFMLVPLICCWKITPQNLAASAVRKPLLNNLFAAGVAIVTVIAGILLYHFSNVQLPDSANQVNPNLLWLSAPLIALYLYFGERRFFDLPYFLSFLRYLNWKHIVLGIGLFVAVKLVIAYFSNGSAGPLTPLRYIALIAQGSMVNPLINLTAHISHYGPVITFSILLWPRIATSVKSKGPGITFVFLLNVYLAMGSESRQFIPFLPFLTYFMILALEEISVDWFTAWMFALLSLIMSRFWLTINVGPWTGELLEFPDQMLFMYTGPWMSDQMYLVFLAAGAIIFIASTSLIRGLCKISPEQKKDDHSV